MDSLMAWDQYMRVTARHQYTSTIEHLENSLTSCQRLSLEGPRALRLMYTYTTLDHFEEPKLTENDLSVERD